MMQQYELVYLPTAPSNFSASLDENNLTINCAEAGNSISLLVPIIYPSNGTQPHPAMITLGPPTIPIPAGVADGHS